MKKTLLFLAIYCLVSFVSTAQQVGIGTTTPDPSAMLDVVSTNKGMLVPRVALFNPDSSLPVAGAAVGLLVYNTATAGIAPNNVIPGFYYWTGTRWFPVVNRAQNPGDMQYWDGTKWVIIPIGANGQVLTICNGIPTWGGCPPASVSIRPQNNLFEGHLESTSPNGWYPGATQLDIQTWTVGGNPMSRRICIKFDYSSIPNGVTIDSAKLYFYSATPPYQQGNFVDAQYGSPNNVTVQRITTNWTVNNQFNWNNQPAVTATNQAMIPQSVTNVDDAVIDVTGIVRDQLTSGNNGFFLRLATESIYKLRLYNSSYNSDAGKRPKIVIWYH